MSKFTKFNEALQQQLTHMERSGELFVVDADKHELWELYLSSFPEGTNPIYKERTQHDCNCCKQFIRDIGAVVAIDGRNKLVSIWDVDAEGEFQVVADALSAWIKSKPIRNVYRHIQKKVGTPKSLQSTEDGGVIQWEHFHTQLKPTYVVSGGRSIGDITGELKTNYEVLRRSLEEISSNAIDVVSELIAENSIYRGQEFKSIITKLKEVKAKYDKIKDDTLRDNFLWKQSSELKQAGRFKNTVIGTLLADISSGVELEDAVKMYESKVAPHNYKRTTALITQGMIDKANKTVNELGIEESLHRRYANENDITINNVLFADRSTKKNMKGGVLDDLTPTKKPALSKKMDNVQEIGIDDFVNNVLPEIDSLEVFVKNKHAGNLVSLIAPENEDSKGIFKWDNNFSWSYNGDVTDSIKERVKKAGGNVVGDVRVSLSWSNYDDLDLHVKEPDGNEIYFSNKRSHKTGGTLDVDMNAGGRGTREPVENIYWTNSRKMTDGDYKVIVNNFAKRESIDVGFDIEVEIHGDIFNYSYDQEVRNKANVDVVTINKKGGEIKIGKEFLTGTTSSKEIWNIQTEDFQKVKMVMNSPNHWDDQVIGNKHWFFMLEGCANPERARGFYNEFLTNDLVRHRKVFEVLSSKMKTEESSNQLSGLGFSSTKRDELLCKVTGSYQRMLKIKF